LLRDNLPYEIDGIIVMIDDIKIFNNLGVVGKSPRGAIAFKFPLKEATTIVNDIFVQIGRTGVLTPVASLKPVDLSGVVVTKATLHNKDEIKRLSLKIGDTVVVGRAGDVIPDIIRVIPSLRTGKEKNFSFPKRCPACFTLIEKIKKTSTVHYCPNKNCVGRLKEYFNYFVSRKAFDFQGLGKKITNKLIENKVVSSPVDLFFLKKEDLLILDGFQDKLAENIINSIQSKKRITLSKLIYSLGIENVGEETATLLENNFQTLDNLKNASLDELISIKDVGEITADNLYRWFREKDNKDFLNKLNSSQVKIIKTKNLLNQKLQGKSFVLTGTLTIPREKIKEEIKKRGGKISEMVSTKTDFIIVGENPGSKLDKAEKLLIKKIKEKEFFKMLNG
jgi:DNA ligase (NAD+)